MRDGAIVAILDFANEGEAMAYQLGLQAGAEPALHGLLNPEPTDGNGGVRLYTAGDDLAWCQKVEIRYIRRNVCYGVVANEDGEFLG